MFRGILRDAYNSLLSALKIGTGADQVAAGDHAHGSAIIWKPKPGPTTIINDSSYNIDPDFRDIAVPVGKYHFRANLYVKTTNAQDFKFKWVFTGTMTLEVLFRAYNEALALQYCKQLNPLIGANVNYPADLTIPRPIILDGVVEVTVAGILELQWAQLTAGGTNTSLNYDSYVTLTPLP